MKTFNGLLFRASLSLAFAVSLNAAFAGDVKMNLPSGNYAHKIGKGGLPDPAGTIQTRQLVADKVVVAVFSVPDMAQGNAQQKWADLLATNPKTKVSNKVFIVMVEDMSQAGMFKGQALSSMKKQFTPTSRPFVVLDNTGKVTKDFGVGRNKTEILIYDKKGNLRDVETNLDDTDKTVDRVKAITNELLKE